MGWENQSLLGFRDSTFRCGWFIFANVLRLLGILGIPVVWSLVFSVVVVSGCVRSSFSIVIVIVVFSGLSDGSILVSVVISILSVVIFVERSVVVLETTFVMSWSFFDNIPTIVSISSVVFSVVILSVSRTSVVSSRFLHMLFLAFLRLILLFSFVGMIATFSWRSIAVVTRMIALLISFLLWFFSGLSFLTSSSVHLSVFSSSLLFFNLCFNFGSFSNFNLLFMFVLLIMVMFLFVLLGMFLFFVMSVMMLILLNFLLLLLMCLMMVMMRVSYLFGNDNSCILDLRNNEDNSFFNFSDWLVVMDEFLRRNGLSDFQLEIAQLTSHISS